MVWRKSSKCGSNACVEVEVDMPAKVVFVRDNTEPGTELAIDFEAWDAFIAGVKDGEFDRPC